MSGIIAVRSNKTLTGFQRGIGFMVFSLSVDK
jgi:hypothetical protein